MDRGEGRRCRKGDRRKKIQKGGDGKRVDMIGEKEEDAERGRWEEGG